MINEEKKKGFKRILKETFGNKYPNVLYCTDVYAAAAGYLASCEMSDVFDLVCELRDSEYNVKNV